MLNFLQPPHVKEQIPEYKIDKKYKKLRFQVFMGIFLGYAGYYLVRKNFSLAMPDLIAKGFSKTELGFALSGVSIAYGISKFIMGSVSDRSNARIFLPLGLVISALIMIMMGAFSFATSSIWIMFFILLLNGWFQGMGWPPSGRIMVHWFSLKERGTKMSIWNVAHNIGGGLIGPLSIAGIYIFADWHSKFYFPGIIALFIAVIAYLLIRDTPQSCGLPTIEKYKNDFPEDYSEKIDAPLTSKEIFKKYIFSNKILWSIALANAFVYLVRYGILDWAPVYLNEVKHFSINETGVAYFAYEYAGIPGTLLCGYLSDKIFKGKRAPVTIIYMVGVALAILLYWKSTSLLFSTIALILIGFLIYGPIMLIGVNALDLVPKKAAGTAAGFTGLFGYVGGALFANIAMGYIVDKVGWNGSFCVLLMACALAILFTAYSWRAKIIKNRL